MDTARRPKRHRYFVASEFLRQGGGSLREGYRARADGVVAKNEGWRFGRDRDEGLGPSALVVLPGVAVEVFVQYGHTAVEGRAIVVARQGFFAPLDGPGHRRFRRLLAAACKAADGAGG
jgi:hypothetical protein